MFRNSKIPSQDQSCRLLVRGKPDGTDILWCESLILIPADTIFDNWEETPFCMQQNKQVAMAPAPCYNVFDIPVQTILHDGHKGRLHQTDLLYDLHVKKHAENRAIMKQINLFCNSYTGVSTHE
jgi:hypothetical protein